MEKNNSSVAKGNAGEHLVMAELLYRGFQAFMADRGNSAYDISVFRKGRYSLLRVKTTTNGCLQYSTKKNGKIFLSPAKKNDYVVIVNFSDRSKAKSLKGTRKADFYVVPTMEVKKALERAHEHYHKFTRKDGKPRKMSSRRCVFLYGNDTTTQISRGYSVKWKKYYEENGWAQL
ncbi:MAG TPA: hypothetical protein VHB73_08175 [Alphaproteobacteria bacterium]|nr:hypothetical protein [Alphaproteobacteria bacterium]